MAPSGDSVRQLPIKRPKVVKYTFKTDVCWKTDNKQSLDGVENNEDAKWGLETEKRKRKITKDFSLFVIKEYTLVKKFGFF